MCMVGVAFLTLLERKVLRVLQARKGPDKNRFWGFLQPFFDVFKLFSKGFLFPLRTDGVLYLGFPLLGVVLILML